MHSRRPIASHVAVVHSEIGRRPVRVARARLGQPQGRGLPVEAQRCLFRRERVGHDACGCPAPRTRCYATAAARTHKLEPTALGSVIWEFRQEASSQPGQGVEGRGKGSAPRNEGLKKKNPGVGFTGEHSARSASARDARAARETQPGTASRPPRSAPKHTQAPAPKPRRP